MILALTIASAALATGCGTVANTTRLAPFEGGPRVYGGVMADLNMMSGPSTGKFTTAMLRLDMPFSAVGDTLTLPYTIACTRRRARLSAAAAADQDITLEGTWRLVSAVYGRPKDGPRGTEVYGDGKVVITADHFESSGPGGVTTTGSYTLYRSERPWAIDFVTKRKAPGLPEPDEQLLGICKVEGDTLTLCVNVWEDGKRPNDFAPAAAAGCCASTAARSRRTTSVALESRL